MNYIEEEELHENLKDVKGKFSAFAAMLNAYQYSLSQRNNYLESRAKTLFGIDTTAQKLSQPEIYAFENKLVSNIANVNQHQVSIVLDLLESCEVSEKYVDYNGRAVLSAIPETASTAEISSIESHISQQKQNVLNIKQNAENEKEGLLKYGKKIGIDISNFNEDWGNRKRGVENIPFSADNDLISGLGLEGLKLKTRSNITKAKQALNYAEVLFTALYIKQRVGLSKNFNLSQTARLSTLSINDISARLNICTQVIKETDFALSGVHIFKRSTPAFSVQKPH